MNFLILEWVDCSAQVDLALRSCIGQPEDCDSSCLIFWFALQARRKLRVLGRRVCFDRATVALVKEERVGVFFSRMRVELHPTNGGPNNLAN